ncbi:hypothetical protein RHSIM_Rhsim11G0149900 [Rhododendron simsii]|uniref:Pyruvate kinase n=1 Tax=Rhododendron simsii TaxID=118357 RepID=A0A834G5A9_RHOSS|nr:hypothetical protein RHSIM_Rhsim11G0149900 [Rhododendron simsii]
MAISQDSAIFCRAKNPAVDFKSRFSRSPVSPIRFCFNVEKFKGSDKFKIGVMAGVEVVGAKSAASLSPNSNLGLDVVTDREPREKGFLGLRKTKLVCTIGPACCSEEDLERLALGGMNVARFNMGHNTREWHREAIRKVRRLNEEKGFCVSVMIDTEGSQPEVDHGQPSPVKAEEGSIWSFTSKKFRGYRPFIVEANCEGFSEGVRLGDELVVDGGMASFKVLDKIGEALRCKCTDPGLLLPRAKVSFWRDGRLVEKNYELPTLSIKDWFDIDFGISEGVDMIALSFVNDADAVNQLKNYLSSTSSKSIRVLAKIESSKSLQKLEEIVEASDGIMVARGDLGVEIPLEHIPAVQQKITQVCRQLNKPVIIASELLESMIEYPTPTRAEVADVSEAVRQFADALMLSGESAIGSFGLKALSVLHTTSSRMELWGREKNQHNGLHQRQLGLSLAEKIAEQICNCAVEMANNLSVQAIFVYTRQGHMASLLSRNRPCPPIFAFTNDASTRMALNLQWGVMPFLVDLSDDAEADISTTIDLMKTKGMVKEGDAVLVVSDVIPSSQSNVSFFGKSFQSKVISSFATADVIQSIQVKTIA